MANEPVVSLTKWHGFEAYSLENDRILIQIVPRLGAKIVSLYDKRSEREWLAPPIRTVKQTEYGQSFVDQDMSGWDEMFPTILPCEWEGHSFPDHGEVWSSPWQMEVQGSALISEGKGTGFPYVLSRKMAFTSINKLKLEYTLSNEGDFRFPWLWAAHPQFLADESTEIVLPATIKKVINVVENDPVFGRNGQIYDWPVAMMPTGERLRLTRVKSPEVRQCRKFYMPPDNLIQWAGLLHHSSGSTLRVRWNADFPIYFGLWVDEGYYQKTTVVALEPSSAYYDGLQIALAQNRVPWIEPGQKIDWTLEIELDQR